MKRTSQMLLNLTGSQLGIKSVKRKNKSLKLRTIQEQMEMKRKLSKLKKNQILKILQKGIMGPLIDCSAIR